MALHSIVFVWGICFSISMACFSSFCPVVIYVDKQWDTKFIGILVLGDLKMSLCQKFCWPLDKKHRRTCLKLLKAMYIKLERKGLEMTNLSWLQVWTDTGHFGGHLSRVHCQWTIHMFELVQETDESKSYMKFRRNQVCLFVCLFCCFTSQVNSYGHCGTVSSPNRTFSWASSNKQLTSTSCTYFRL